MKLRNGLIILALIAGVFLIARQARAQGDTLTVQWQSGGLVVTDALYNAFYGDTLGRPAGRVYKLLKGGYYENTKTIDNTGRPLRIVGEAATANPDSFPPLLQMVRAPGATGVPRMFTVQNDLTLMNLYITGADDLGVQTSYQPIQVDGSGYRIIVDHCIFDRTNFALIAFQGGANNVIYYTNNYFRNLLERPPTQKYTGRAVSIWANQDTVIFENNTIFLAGFCAFQMESGAITYLRFNHNTMVNVGRNNFIGSWWRTARFANNLFINPFWHGEDNADINSSGRDPRAYNSGFFGIGPLPSLYGPEQGRSILFTNAAAYRDPLFTTYYADTIRPQYYVNRVTKEDFLDKFPDNNKIQDTSWITSHPNFTYPDSLIPKMWANIIGIRGGSASIPTYFYELAKVPGGTDECYVCAKWPLPETFTYSTPANLLTAGTDGLPLGDLNWFPTQKAQFLANYAANVKHLEDLAPKPASFAVDSTLEAERGQASGGATVETFQGFSYFQMDGGGFFEWKFNVATPGPRNLRVYTNMRGNDTRGQHTYFNGSEIHDSAFGYGELIYSKNAGPNGTNPNEGMPLNEWTWAKFDVSDIKAAERGALDLHVGENTLKVSSSWGYQNFAEFDLVLGTDTIKLKAADATNFAVVTPKGEATPGVAAKWVPSFFKSVAMGTNGSVQWTVNPKSAGNYALQLFYQNYGTAQTATIKWDGNTVGTVSLTPKTDSTGVNVLAYPPSFPVTTGAHTLAVTASGVNLDFVQLQKVVTGVSSGNGLPEAYTLEQNYPNPFNPATTINFALTKASNVKLVVYNILGQQVATLVNGQLNAGTHTVKFDAGNLASGVYFYRLEAGQFISNKKMMLLK